MFVLEEETLSYFLYRFFQLLYLKIFYLKKKIKKLNRFFIYLLIFASILMISVVLAILGFIYEKKWHKNFHFDTTKSLFAY